MSFDEELKKEVRSYFRTEWDVSNTKSIPKTEDIGLGNKAKKSELTMLYADMAESTNLVDNYDPLYAAEIYKSFLYVCCKIIRRNGGDLVSFDGDRVMGAFIGENKNSIAAKTALNIKWAIKDIVQVQHDEYYRGNGIKLNYSIGIDYCEHHIVRTGMRNNNDLLWVGKAANYAAKITSHNWDPYHTIISSRVYSRLNESSKFDAEGKNMWHKDYSDAISETVYKSNYYWEAT